MGNEDQLDTVFAALANPTRRAILARLAEGEASVGTLAEPFDMSLPAVSQHIRVLENAGLITRSRDAQFRPCALNAASLRAVVHWTEGYRHIWDVRFEAMEKIIEEVQGVGDG